MSEIFCKSNLCKYLFELLQHLFFSREQYLQNCVHDIGVKVEAFLSEEYFFFISPTHISSFLAFLHVLCLNNSNIMEHISCNNCNITKEEQEAIKTLRTDPSHMVLTADKGVALVVMDKSQYVDKCMALLNDTKVYKPCKDTTKKLHRDVQETL